jgi:hypothetical protein
MDATIAGLIGAFIGAAAGVIVSIVNNKYQLRQLQAQWAHEEKRAEIESESAKGRQTKERLQDIYANAARSLSEVMMIVNQEGYESGYMPKELPEKVGEAQRCLSLIVIEYYGDREDAKFKTFYTSLVTFAPQESGFKGNVDHLRRCVIEFAKNDPRLT